MSGMDQRPGKPVANAPDLDAPARRRLGGRDWPEVMTMAGEPKAPGRLPRRMTRFLMSPNKLRRSSDRTEAVIVALLSAAFLCAVAIAPYFGMRVSQWERARAAQLHHAVAVLSQAGPPSSYWFGYGQVAARWQVPDGQWRSGTLTTEAAPGIFNAPAGARVQVWLTGSGEPADPPKSRSDLVSGDVIVAVATACGAGVVLIICYWLCRLVLDRRRLAAWESDWALTGPRWTTRQG